MIDVKSEQFKKFKDAAKFGQVRLAIALFIPILEEILNKLNELQSEDAVDNSTAPSRKVTKGPKATPAPKEEEAES